MAAQQEANGAEAQPQMIPVILHSQSAKYQIPSSKFFVPQDWRRFQLSELLNRVLEHEKAVPFDFVLDEGKELLRSSLGDALKSKGLTEETALEIEYIESILPPNFIAKIPCEDWISDVSLAKPGYILSSCYDGSVNVFSTATNTRLATVQPHTLSALCACWVEGSSDTLIASGGMDRRILISQLRLPEEPVEVAQSTSKILYRLEGHNQAVSSVQSSPFPTRNSKPLLLSSSRDSDLRLWSLDPSLKISEASTNGQTKKKRRTMATQSDGTLLAPKSILRGHTRNVAKAIFSKVDPNIAYSASWDHTLRSWDLETGNESNNRMSDKVLTSLDQMASSNLLVTGAVDCSVCFWDFRQETAAISLTLLGHTSQVSAIKAHPTSALLAASASFDGTVRIWDARSPKQALFTIQRDANTDADFDADFAKLKGPDKVLALDWNGEFIVSGGEDKKLQTHQARV